MLCGSFWSTFLQESRGWGALRPFAPFSLLFSPLCVLVAQACLILYDPMDHSCQASLSMGCSRQEYWGGSPCPPTGHLPDPGIEPSSFLLGPLPCWNWKGSRFVEPPPTPASPGTALLDTPLTGGACPSGCFKPLFVGVPGHVWPAGSVHTR